MFYVVCVGMYIRTYTGSMNYSLQGDKPRKGEQNYDVWCSEDTLPNAVKIKVSGFSLKACVLLGSIYVHMFTNTYVRTCVLVYMH